MENVDSRQVSDKVAGYIVHKTQQLYRDCCQSQLLNEELNTEYIKQLSHGGLKNPSLPLNTVVSQSFDVLDESSPALRLFNVPARKTRMKILAKYVKSTLIVCENYTNDFSNRVLNVV